MELEELKFEENVLKNGKKEIKKNMLEALDEFLDMVADESWCAVEEIISLRKENAELREQLIKIIKFALEICDGDECSGDESVGLPKCEMWEDEEDEQNRVYCYCGLKRLLAKLKGE